MIFGSRQIEALALLLVAALASGCASSSVADGYFEDGKYTQALAAYGWLLESEDKPSNEARSLYRLGLIYALPDSPVRDEKKALELFDDLRQRFPKSAYRRSADLIVALFDEIELLESGVFAQQIEIEQLSDSLTQKVTNAEGETREREQQIATLDRELAFMKRKVVLLNKELGNSLRSIDQLNELLERLKNIDIASKPQSPSSR